MKTLKVNRKELENKSETPAFDYCRKLLSNGVDPGTRLEIYRDNEDFDYAVTSIGEGAKWSVDHCMFIPYRKYHARKTLKGAQDVRQASLVSLND